MKPHRLGQLLVVLTFYALLVGVYFIYEPGLTGKFVFDDFPNLAGLATITSPTDWAHLLQYIATPLAGPLGRPVTLLTFASEYYAWPHNPGVFIHLNIIIHILNTALVFWLALLLAERLRLGARARDAIALLTCAIWALQPIFVSGIVYIVQRMNELSGSFTLVGLIAFLYARQQIRKGNFRSAYSLLFIVYGLCLVLATFSKENGILLTVYAMVLMFFEKDEPAEPIYKAWKTLYIYTPLILLSLYFITKIPFITDEYRLRDFTLWQRLITETRILFNYLGKFLIPQPGTYGLYHDDYLKSVSLLNPATGLLASSAWLVIVGLAIKARATRYWLLGFAALWFLGGHLLESTFLPLELYFEHRNYIPLVGPSFVLACGVYFFYRYASHAKLLQTTFIIAFAVYLLSLALTTYGETSLWGRHDAATIVRAAEHPNSRRYQGDAAISYISIGQYAKALHIIKKMYKNNPNTPLPAMMWLLLDCVDPSITLPPMEEVLTRLRSGIAVVSSVTYLDKMRNNKMQGMCPGISYSDIIQMIDAMAGNPRNHSYLDSIYFIKAHTYLSSGDTPHAITALEKSVDIKQNVGRMLSLIDLLINNGQLDDARHRFLQVKNRVQYHVIEKWVYAKRIAHLDTTLKELSNPNAGNNRKNIDRHTGAE